MLKWIQVTHFINCRLTWVKVVNGFTLNNNSKTVIPVGNKQTRD